MHARATQHAHTHTSTHVFAHIQYWHDQRERGDKSKKNSSCVPYDAITLKYNDSLDGERLR